ncbi:MAG: hypothetical protein AAB478_02195 [Patescibacteria group bacterium]
MASISTVSASDPLLLTSPVTTANSEQNLCLATLPDSLMELNYALTPARFERVDASNVNSVVITQAKDGMLHSFGSEKTVLSKATIEELVDANTTPTPIQPVQEPVVTIIPTAEVLAAEDQVSSSQLSADVLFNLVNATRANYGLAPFQKDDRICNVAVSRAPELDSEIWVTRTMHAGFYARNLPYWATENVISTRTEQQALNWWMHSPVHRSALLGNWKYACVACSGKSCSMIFTNFDMKQTAPVIQVATPTPATAGVTPQASVGQTPVL